MYHVILSIHPVWDGPKHWALIPDGPAQYLQCGSQTRRQAGSTHSCSSRPVRNEPLSLGGKDYIHCKVKLQHEYFTMTFIPVWAVVYHWEWIYEGDHGWHKLLCKKYFWKYKLKYQWMLLISKCFFIICFLGCEYHSGGYFQFSVLGDETQAPKSSISSFLWWWCGQEEEWHGHCQYLAQS